MTGVVTTPPMAPSEVMVMVEPDSSSRVAVPALAASASRLTSARAVPEVARLGVLAPPARPARAGVCVAMPIWTPP